MYVTLGLIVSHDLPLLCRILSVSHLCRLLSFASVVYSTHTVLHSKRVDELHADWYSSIEHRKRQDGTQKRFAWLVLRSYIKQHINMYVLMTGRLKYVTYHFSRDRLSHS